jgi:hypothetical protein
MALHATDPAFLALRLTRDDAVCGEVAQRAYRGMAFRHQGMHDAAHESLKEALKARSRDMSIRHLALSERAEHYLAQNKKAMARKDLEHVLADDSGVEGVAERLAALSDA